MSVEERSHSLRSVSSNSSISSGTSLSRRPRTRTRSKTLTGKSSPRPSGIVFNNEEASALVQEPLAISPVDNSSMVAQSRAEVPNWAITDSLDSASTGKFKAEPIRVTKAAKQASQLTTISVAPSAFSRVPLSHLDSGVVNVRDSVITQSSEATQQTHASSSIYPPSTISASTPSPRSPVESDVQEQVPIVDEYPAFDEDDVSYRLRLLVNNNYFLPPAHSKPLPSPVPPSLPKKPPTPTFMDLFRLGKSKSKPSTPTSEAPVFNGITPALRTTSDSTAISGFLAQVQPPASSNAHAPRTSNLGRPERSGRVVVVREKMADLATAAKQAELEMKKARAVRREQIVEDVIDPTDAVDLPPQSGYPFTVQASALHGLGVSESLGAAALADHLPPRSPGVLSQDTDDDWKTALLKAAVGHSFDNLAAAAEGNLSPLPQSPATSSMLSLGPVPSSTMAATKISRKIISSPIQLENNYASSSRSFKSLPAASSQGHVPAHSRGMSSPISNSSSPIPLRTETPLMPLTPLTPPPRRQFINPVYSISQTDLTEAAGAVMASSSSHPLSGGSNTTNTVFSPRLSNEYDIQAGTFNYALAMTPPPLLGRRDARDSSETMSFLRSSSGQNTSRSSRRGGSVASGFVNPDSVSGYSVVTEDGPRDTNESSRETSSISSINSNALSPTTSAFQDALSRSPSEARIVGEAAESEYQEQRPSRTALPNQDFHSVANTNRPPSPPPPRPSSSLILEPLPPPPRGASLHYRDMRNRHLSAFNAPPSTHHSPPPPSLTHRSSSDHGHGSSTPSPPAPRRRPPTAPADPMTHRGIASSPDVEIFEISGPEPTTPPFPSLVQRRHLDQTLRNLHIPTTSIPQEIHSAPPPSSPTMFFDKIQTQPNAMDFLEESSEESDSDSESDGECRKDGGTAGCTRGGMSVVHSTHSIHSIHSVHSTRSVLSTSSRAPIMRLGNHSTPYVSQKSYNEEISPPPPLPSGAIDRMQPISNIPQSTTFFNKKIRGEQGVIESTLDLYQSSRQSRVMSPTGVRRAASSEASRDRSDFKPIQESPLKGQESAKLDGMVKVHMEAEKDRIKQIASSMKQTKTKMGISSGKARDAR